MRQLSAAALTGLAVDIRSEVDQLQRLEESILAVRAEVENDPARADIYYENLALKLHNFYTGCERIFNLIVAELNGAPLSGYDWHQRLLERMAAEWEGRPPVLATETVRGLREYLAFRHVVRNIYGFELDPARIEGLVQRYPTAWQAFRHDIDRFIDWLHALADELR